MPWFASKTFKGSAVIDENFIHEYECPQEFYLMVNQKIRQEGNLKDMIFSFEDIILHLSKIVDFKKGDIIFTGTPEGVGALERGDQIDPTATTSLLVVIKTTKAKNGTVASRYKNVLVELTNLLTSIFCLSRSDIVL